MGEKRRQWSGEQILAILKRNLVEKVELSKICEDEQISPSMFYRWQAQLFAEGAAVFQRKNAHSGRRERLDQIERITALEEKLQKKNEVLSELMEEHIQLKKELGEN